MSVQGDIDGSEQFTYESALGECGHTHCGCSTSNLLRSPYFPKFRVFPFLVQKYNSIYGLNNSEIV